MNSSDLKLFVIDLTYVCSLSEIDALIPEHSAYLQQGYADGVFLASGRKHPRTGGVILATCGSRAAIEDRAISDPFVRHGLASVSVTEFHPSTVAPALLSALATGSR